jgi:hypothetical protein
MPWLAEIQANLISSGLTLPRLRPILGWSEYGAFVYQLGHGPLKAERRVRFPYALPTFFVRKQLKYNTLQEFPIFLFDICRHFAYI